MTRYRTQSRFKPLHRTLWRFDNLCARQQWVPLAIIFVLAVLVMIIEGVAP